MDIWVTRFDVPLWEALALVRSSDLMIGMHGAALTNALALRPVSLPSPDPSQNPNPNPTP